MFNATTKISVLGCGWAGLPIATSFSRDGMTVKGSVTSFTRFSELAFNGILPYEVRAGFQLEGDRLEGFFECDVLVVTLPPPRMDGMPDVHLRAHGAIARAFNASSARRLVLLSSTSVYPDLNRAVDENDAAVFTSPHSGVAMLSIEECYRNLGDKEIVVLRLGGLMGPGRHPGRFLRGRASITSSEAPVNLVHLDDVVGAVRYAASLALPAGAYNVCSPESMTRGDFYLKALEALNETPPPSDGVTGEWKRVSSERIINEGYVFVHANPARWLS